MHPLPFAILLLGLPALQPARRPIPGGVDPAPPFVPTLAIEPARAAITPGGTLAFKAAINHPAGVRYIRQPVAWRVVEAEGGTVTPAGLYTAPSQPGKYHVEARREDFRDVAATATVTVR